MAAEFLPWNAVLARRPHHLKASPESAERFSPFGGRDTCSEFLPDSRWPVWLRAQKHKAISAASIRFAAGPGPRRFLVQEFGWGLARGAELTLESQVALTGVPAVRGGSAGIPLSLLVNLSTERERFPGLAVRVESWFPGGDAAGHGVGTTLRGMATRSFGSARLHVNGSLALVHPDALGQRDLPLWSAGAAFDRTLIRSATLLLTEATWSREARGAPMRSTLGVGLRRQISPVVVLDAGVFVAFSRRSQQAGLSLGLSHITGDGLFFSRRGR